MPMKKGFGREIGELIINPIGMRIVVLSRPVSMRSSSLYTRGPIVVVERADY